MKHFMLSVVAILAATAFSFAQTYSIIPNDTFEIVGGMEDLQTLTISQLNTGTDTLYMKWKKVSESVPANWEASVCDNSVCYTVLLDSGLTNPVYPAESGFILLHVTPHVTYGTAIIRYAIWDIANPAWKDTLTFITTVNAPSGITEAENKNIFNIFPNPVKDNINIVSNLQTGFQFVITDMSGKEIRKGISKTNSISVSTENFSNGIYQIELFSENKIISTKKIVVQ